MVADFKLSAKHRKTLQRPGEHRTERELRAVVEVLRPLNFFKKQKLDDQKFTNLIRNADLVKLDPGQILFRLGDPAGLVYIVLRGHIGVVRPVERPAAGSSEADKKRSERKHSLFERSERTQSTSTSTTKDTSPLFLKPRRNTRLSLNAHSLKPKPNRTPTMAVVAESEPPNERSSSGPVVGRAGPLRVAGHSGVAEMATGHESSATMPLQPTSDGQSGLGDPTSVSNHGHQAGASQPFGQAGHANPMGASSPGGHGDHPQLVSECQAHSSLQAGQADPPPHAIANSARLISGSEADPQSHSGPPPLNASDQADPSDSTEFTFEPLDTRSPLHSAGEGDERKFNARSMLKWAVKQVMERQRTLAEQESKNQQTSALMRVLASALKQSGRTLALGRSGFLTFSVKDGEFKVAGYDVLAIVTSGSCFGEIAAVTGHQRSATAVALLPTELLAISQSEYNSVIKADTNVTMAAFLTTVQGLTTVPLPLLTRLSFFIEPLRFSRDDVILRQFAPSDNRLYILFQGQIRLVRRVGLGADPFAVPDLHVGAGPAGYRDPSRTWNRPWVNNSDKPPSHVDIEISTLCEGDVFGDIAALLGGTIQENAVCMTDVEVSVLSVTDLRACFPELLDGWRANTEAKALFHAERAEHELESLEEPALGARIAAAMSPFFGLQKAYTIPPPARAPSPFMGEHTFLSRAAMIDEVIPMARKYPKLPEKPKPISPPKQEPSPLLPGVCRMRHGHISFSKFYENAKHIKDSLEEIPFRQPLTYAPPLVPTRALPRSRTTRSAERDSPFQPSLYLDSRPQSESPKATSPMLSPAVVRQAKSLLRTLPLLEGRSADARALFPRSPARPRGSLSPSSTRTRSPCKTAPPSESAARCVLSQTKIVLDI